MKEVMETLLLELIDHVYTREEEIVGLMIQDSCGSENVHKQYEGALSEIRRIIRKIMAWSIKHPAIIKKLNESL